MFSGNTPENISSAISELEKRIKGSKQTHIGPLLARIRDDRGETFYVMARRIKIPEGLLSRYRRGYSLPSKEFIERLKLEYATTSELISEIDTAVEKDKKEHDRSIEELEKLRYIQRCMYRGQTSHQ